MNRYEKYIGKTLGGHYYIRSLIGLGGSSVVFEGIDTEHEDRAVAIKMLREELWGEKVYMERLFAEADTLASLDHPCIAKLYDRYTGKDMQYLVMEYVEGITLKQYLTKKGRLETATVVSIVAQILQVLSYLHQNGIVHGDIKPQNILLQTSGRIVLSDFGVARQSEEDSCTDMYGKAVGTVYYLSPEQARGREGGVRSDLYSLGVMMYEMVSGELPFVGDDAEEVARKHIEATPTPLRSQVPTLSKGMEQIIFGAMEKQLPMRYQSADQMLSELLLLQNDPFMTFAPHPGLRYSNPDEKVELHTESEAVKKEKVIFHAPLIRRNSNAFLPYLLGICFAFLVVGLILLFYGYDRIFKDSRLNVFAVDEVESVIVQNYIGLPMTDVLKDELSELGFNVKITEEFSANVEKGMIMAQSPDPTAVRKVGGFTLELVVSKGKDMQTISDYSLLNYMDVKYELMDLGYLVTVIMVDNAGFDYGTIVTTYPSPGAILESGEEVTLFVSRGPTIQYVAVPKLIGYSEKKVMELLIANQLVVGKVTYYKTDEFAKGTILEQSIKQDAYVPINTKIDLVIAS